MVKNDFILKIKTLLSFKDKKTLLILLIMSFFLSLIEIVGIAAIMPFISIASDPTLIHSNQYYSSMYDFFSISNNQEFIILFGVFLIIFYFFRGFYIIFHGYLVSRFAMKKYHDFVVKLFSNYIYMPYQTFVNHNSATLSKTIMTEAAHVSFLVQNFLQLLSELVIIVLIYGILLLVDLKMTIVLTVVLSIKVYFLMKIVSKKIKKEGEKRATLQDEFYRKINATLGNFKVLKFISNQGDVIKEFRNISNQFKDVYSSNSILQLIPRNVLETLGFSILIFIVVYVVGFENNIKSVIPIISMYALAMYRILPATTRVINSYNNIIFYAPSLNIVYNDISMKYQREYENDISFSNFIIVSNLSFKYKSENIIKNLNLKIQKGQKVAFIGESGSGKSTLVDLICGIYRPDEGKILIDGVELNNSNIVSWRKKIGYIPQSIYLFDGTIAENITFGREYNKDKLIEVLKQANIYDTLVTKNGLHTMVGEGGIQLSGGQKQRIGIARALYGDPEILVLDEATSALDTQTEKAIMDEIYKISGDKTLMIIAHRLSTIEKCDIKIDLDEVN